MLEVATGVVRDRVRAVVLRAARSGGDVVGELFAPDSVADPYPHYARIRARGPVVRSPMSTVTADHATCERILRHPATRTATASRDEFDPDTSRLERWLFSTPDRSDVVEPISADSMIGRDGAEHARLRGLASAVFTPRAVARLRPRLTRVCEELVDAAVRRGDAFDLMAEVAGVFPVLAICEVLGIPERDHRQFKDWGAALASDLDALPSAPQQRAATQALRELGAYLSALAEDRRREPRDDVLSGLVRPDADGDVLTERELLGTCMLLLVAGFETTVNLLGNGTLALLQHREQLAWLREDLDRVPGAVEELLRFDAPVQLSARFTGEPLESDDGTVPAGERVTLLLGGANRDPAVFRDPDTLDLGRPDARRHLALASGPHYCLGAALARLEGEIAFTTLLERVPRLRLAGPVVRRPTLVLRGLASLPLAPG